jgi:hypothetical protein
MGCGNDGKNKGRAVGLFEKDDDRRPPYAFILKQCRLWQPVTEIFALLTTASV